MITQISPIAAAADPALNTPKMFLDDWKKVPPAPLFTELEDAVTAGR
jgi:hypothetical protein